MLKDAFVQGRLTKDEFDARVAYAFTSPTRADLAALTARVHGLPRLYLDGHYYGRELGRNLTERVTGIGHGGPLRARLAGDTEASWSASEMRLP